MPRQGNGTYVLPTSAGNPVVPLSPIASSWANPTLQDIANALTQSVSNDGQTPFNGNLNLANNKLVNLASGSANSDSVNYGQVFNSPAFFGNPTAPTQPNGDNSTNLATTAFVKTALAQFIPFYEGVTTVTTALPAMQNFNLAVNQVLLCTANAANNTTINLTGNVGVTLATYMPAGNVITFAILLQQGATAFAITNWQVDGNAITPRTLGGAVITAGNPNGVDIYNASLVRDAGGTYSLFLSQQSFS